MIVVQKLFAFSTTRLSTSIRNFWLPTDLSRVKLEPVSPSSTCVSSTKNFKKTYQVVDTGTLLQQPKQGYLSQNPILWIGRLKKINYLIKFLRPIVSEKTYKRMNRVCHSEFDPPESVRGMTTLDKSYFKKTAKVLCVRVPVKSMSVFSKKMKNSLLKIPNIRSIAEAAEDDPQKNEVKIVLLDPQTYSTVNDIKEEDKLWMTDLDIDVTAIKPFEIDLGYDNWTASEILKAILPADSDSVSGFSTIGHIAHLNLKNELLDYKLLIGEVILDKIKTVKTVVNKLNTIDNTYRNFQMELLAGEQDYVTTARENGCSFELDFSKVYWNSRLATEHSRIVGLCPGEAVVYDVFAGVGPFTVPLLRKGCSVLANDLNPESFKWLKQNIQVNKTKGEVETYNLDGREFICSVVKQDLTTRWKQSAEEKMSAPLFVVMNLPAMAIEFLDAFVNIGEDLSQECRTSEFVKMPQVFCYCFTKAEDAKEDITARVGSVLGGSAELALDLFFVRNVAPNKDMYRVSFYLPREVVFRKQCGDEEEESDPNSDDIPVRKRQKLS